MGNEGGKRISVSSATVHGGTRCCWIPEGEHHLLACTGQDIPKEGTQAES